MNRWAALPAGGAAIREAQAILRRQGAAMNDAIALLDRIAEDMVLDAELLERLGLPARARRCGAALADVAAAACPDNTPAPAPASAVDGSLEAFLARQRDRVAGRGGTWGGVPGRHRNGRGL